MAAVLQAPFLSAYDPVSEAEGSIDPLGLAGTYERLADMMLPGIAVRMRRPRFLTALAVGAHVCRDFEPETLAKDGVSPPYLVFEWWVVEAFARAADQLAEKGRIPGIQKAQNAIRNGRPLSAPAYLQVPSVFGFTGIFRRLARHTQILTRDGTLDEAGHQLVDVWARERGLDGFLYGREGSGAMLREDLRRAVKDGLRDAHTSHRPRSFWEAIAVHLDPAKPGRKERALLLQLIEDRAGVAEEVRFVTDSLKRRGGPIDIADEAKHLQALQRSAPDRLRSILTAVHAYESLCRPLTDAFDLLCYLASQDPARGVTEDDFAKHRRIAKLTEQLAQALAPAADNAIIGEVWQERAHVLAVLREGSTPRSLFKVLMQHHREAQARKPPDGKRPWLEEDARGRLLVRAAYRIDEEPMPRSSYVHDYRLPTLSRFLEDLGAYR